MTEVPLSALKQWYEDNVAKTSTLEILRCMFQGNFPGAPVSTISSLGKNWHLFEDRRNELGDEEFKIYLQCQMAAFKAYYKTKPFFAAWCVGDKAGERYLRRREKIIHSGYYFFGSEVYRVSFPNECAALGEYFRQWLRWDGKREEEEPNWPEIKISFAPRSHPFWVTLSCNYETAAGRGAEYCAIWLSGKKRLKARNLMQEGGNEYDRACIDALVLTANQVTSARAREFTVLPEAEFSFPYQVAVQIYNLRKEIVTSSLPLRIRVGDGNENIDGVPS
jgi:hypothetical protein